MEEIEDFLEKLDSIERSLAEIMQLNRSGLYSEVGRKSASLYMRICGWEIAYTTKLREAENDKNSVK